MIKRAYTKVEPQSNDTPNPFLPVFNAERWERMLDEAPGGGTIQSRDEAYVEMFERWKNYIFCKRGLEELKVIQDARLARESETAITNPNVRRPTMAKPRHNKNNSRKHSNRKRS